MKSRAIMLAFAAARLLAACHSDASVQHVNQQQADELNAIAANTSDMAGNEAAQNGARDVGDIYRSGAHAPPRHY